MYYIIGENSCKYIKWKRLRERERVVHVYSVIAIIITVAFLPVTTIIVVWIMGKKSYYYYPVGSRTCWIHGAGGACFQNGLFNKKNIITINDYQIIDCTFSFRTYFSCLVSFVAASAAFLRLSLRASRLNCK